jgi:hypothetical protein
MECLGPNWSLIDTPEKSPKRAVSVGVSQDLEGFRANLHPEGSVTRLESVEVGRRCSGFERLLVTQEANLRLSTLTLTWWRHPAAAAWWRHPTADSLGDTTSSLKMVIHHSL